MQLYGISKEIERILSMSTAQPRSCQKLKLLRPWQKSPEFGLFPQRAEQ